MSFRSVVISLRGLGLAAVCSSILGGQAVAAGPGYTQRAGDSLAFVGGATVFFDNADFEAGDQLSFKIEVLTTTNPPGAAVYAFANNAPEFNSKNESTAVGIKLR